MTPTTNHKRLDEEGQAIIEELLQERLRLAIKYTLVQVLEEEVDAFVNAAPYQRTPERRDRRNGQQAQWRCTGLLPDKFKRVFETPEGVGKLRIDKQDVKRYLLHSLLLQRATKLR